MVRKEEAMEEAEEGGGVVRVRVVVEKRRRDRVVIAVEGVGRATARIEEVQQRGKEKRKKGKLAIKE